MKKLFALLFPFAAGCSDHKNETKETSHRSRSQSSIENLADGFKAEYGSTSLQAEKEMVTKKYREKIQQYLSNHYLNHMHVHIDTVLTNGLTINTRFHTDGNVGFRSSMEFHKPMPPKERDLYQFMQGLKQGSDTSIDFEYVGKYELDYPDEGSKPALIISAFPLSYQVHGHR